MPRWMSFLVGVVTALILFVPLPDLHGEVWRWQNPSLLSLFIPEAEASYRYSILKSMQCGTITIASGASSGTATITSVSTTNAWVGWTGQTTDRTETTVGSGGKSAGRVTLTNATTVTAAQNDTGGYDSRQHSYCVTELRPGYLAQAPQDFSINLNGVASNTATITSANTSKTLIVLRGYTADGDASTTANQWWIEMHQTNATTITATTKTAADAYTRQIHGTAVTFK